MARGYDLHSDRSRLVHIEAKSGLVGFTDQNHLSSFELGFLNIFSRQNLLRSLYCFCYSATNMARKNVQKTTFDSTSEMI